MLRPAVHDLLSAGTRVLLVARRPERADAGAPDSGQLIPVAADWSEPEELGRKVREAAGGRPIDEAILWVHTPYDAGVHQALDPLLSPGATVAQLWGSAGADPNRSRPLPEQYRPPRNYRSVVLGFTRTTHGTRWLTDREISNGALRGLSEPDPEQTVGRTQPWSDRP